MKRIKIAIVALKRHDDYIMHLRQGDTSRGAIDLIGFFGGMVDEGEPAIEAAARELGEETNINLPTSKLKSLGKVTVESDFDHQPVSVAASVFEAKLPKNTEVSFKHEGELDEVEDEIVIANRAEINEFIKANKLTPATRAAFKELIGWL
jgi:8-oxo-dGTP pyrophosphatase MutT (NUDIX family)